MGSFLKRDLAGSKRFKEKLQKKEIATLINVSHPSPSLVERLAEIGFDAMLIEAEHGSVSRDRVEDMARAAALAGRCALIRPEGSIPHLITGYLGCGIDGFMLPLIESAAHAQSLVDQFRFSAPIDYPNRPLIAMIERIEAVESLPEILKIKEIDAFLVAPWDLALTMGVDFTKTKKIPQAVHETIDRAIATIVESGATCGMRVEFETAQAFIEKGVTLIYEHSDNMMRDGAARFLGILQPADRAAA